jgi:hypothetical protein
MEPIEYYGLREANLERIAARHHLSFHLSDELDQKIPGFLPQYFQVISHCCEDEKRSATDEEVAMWQALCPEDPDTLETLPEEIESSWEPLKGPFTINAKDYAVIREMGREFLDPCTRRDGLLMGLVGTYKERTSIYVSRSIPVGLFYEGEYIPELHWRPDPKTSKRTLAPELPINIVCELQMGLRPFKLRG